MRHVRLPSSAALFADCAVRLLHPESRLISVVTLRLPPSALCSLSNVTSLSQRLMLSHLSTCDGSLLFTHSQTTIAGSLCLWQVMSAVCFFLASDCGLEAEIFPTVHHDSCFFLCLYCRTGADPAFIGTGCPLSSVFRSLSPGLCRLAVVNVFALPGGE